MINLVDYANEPFFQYLFKFKNGKYHFNHEGFGSYENAEDYEKNKRWKVSYEE